MSRNSTTPAEWFAASEAGAPRYYDPRPCSHGHVGERWTSNMGCIACRKAAQVKRKPLPARRPSAARMEPISMLVMLPPDDLHYVRTCVALLASEQAGTLRAFLLHHGKGLSLAPGWILSRVDK